MKQRTDGRPKQDQAGDATRQAMGEHTASSTSSSTASSSTSVLGTPDPGQKLSDTGTPFMLEYSDDSGCANPPFACELPVAADDQQSVSSEMLGALEEAYEDVLECSQRAISEMKGASHKVMEEAQRAIEKLYYTFHELPDHMKDNDYILTGYRAYYSAKQCVSSIFRVHNETMNIWTHLLGSLAYCALLLISFHFVPVSTPIVDKIILSIFLCSATQCLFCSSAFHTFCAHKHYNTYQKFQIMDYCGISCLICGSFLTYLHYGFYKHLIWRIIYYSVIGALWIFGFVLPWFPFFRSLKFRIWRAVYYVLMGVCLFVLCCHAMIVNSALGFIGKIGWSNLILELSFYLIGATIYATRYPERWFPGKLDIFCHSHQIWHVFILIASVFHFRGTLNLMESYIGKT